MGRACDDVNSRFHEIGVTFGYYVARAIECYVRGRYLEVDASQPSERAKSASFKQAKRSKQLEICEPAGRFNSAIWTNFCADTHSCFIPGSFYRSCLEKEKGEKREIEREREKERGGEGHESDT